MRGSVERLEEARGHCEALGGELKGFYLTLERYDVVVPAEFPDDEAAAKVNLTIASGRTASSETLKAFSEEQFRDVDTALPERELSLPIPRRRGEPW